MRLNGLLILAAILVLIPAPIFAGNWVLVGAEGNSPNRSHFYAEFDMVDQRYDSEAEGGDQAMLDAAMRSRNMGAYLDERRVMRVRVIQVLEAAQNPDTIEYYIGIKCKARQFRVLDSTAWQRNSRSEKLGGTNWTAIGSNWASRVHLIACDPQKLQKAIATAQKSGKNDALAKLGFVYVGNMFIGTELSDATWANFWRDGKRPAYSTIYTPQESEARRQAALAELKKAETEFGNKATDIRRDLELQKKIERGLGSVNEKYYREMQGMSGANEERIVATFGPPQGYSEANGTRRFDYYFQDTVYDLVQEQMDVMQCQQGICGKVGETGGATTTKARIVQCQRTLFLRPGASEPGYRLVDFQINCN